MDRLQCVSIVSFKTPKLAFVGKYLVNANYSPDTITDILEELDLSGDNSKPIAIEYEGLKYLIYFIGSRELICIVSTKSYKSRLLAQLIDEIQLQHQEAVRTGKKSYTYLKTLGDKYNDPATIDLLVRTAAKLEGVKTIMQENIEEVLKNCVKLEELELKAQELAQNAGIFKRDAGALQRKMWWKNMKMKIYLALIILTVIGVLTGILCAIYPPNSK